MSDPKNFYITSIFLKPMIILEVYKVIYFFCITADEFRRLFRHSAVRRAKLEGLVRNAEAIKR